MNIERYRKYSNRLWTLDFKVERKIKREKLGKKRVEIENSNRELGTEIA